jgi:hypothetical protein
MRRRRSIVKIAAVSAVLAAVFVPIVAASVWHVLHGSGAAIYTNVYGWRYGHGEVSELRELQSRTPYTDPGASK